MTSEVNLLKRSTTQWLTLLPHSVLECAMRKLYKFKTRLFIDLNINLMLQTETRCRLNGLVNVKALAQRIISLNVIKAYLWTHIYPNDQSQHNRTVYILTQDLTSLLFRDQVRKEVYLSIKLVLMAHSSFFSIPLWKQQRMISNMAVKQIKALWCISTKRICKSNLQLSDFVSTYLFMRYCSTKRCKPGLISTGSAVPAANLPCYLNKPIIKLIIRATADSARETELVY